MLGWYLGQERLPAVLRALAVFMLLVAAGLPQRLEAAPAADAPVSVTITDNTLDPKEITITAGTVVTWTHKGKNRQRIRSVEQKGVQSSEWNSENLRPGDSFSRRFDTPGRFEYYFKDTGDTYTGAITVVAGPSAPTKPAPVPPGVAPAPAPATPPSPPPAAPPAANNPSEASASVQDNDFVPVSLTVSAGTTVTWKHTGKRPHTVTSDTGLWDSGNMVSGQSFSFTFQNPGAYTYNCAFHGGMDGTIIVTGSSGATPPAAPSKPAPPAPPAAPPASPAPSNPAPGQTAPAPGAPPASSPAPNTPTPANPPAAPPAAPAPGANAVSLSENVFSPLALTVTPGTKVSWKNDGKKPHTVTSDAGVWDSGNMTVGQSFSFTFQNPGAYTYNCTYHDGMVGTINVSGAGAAPGPTPPAPAPVIAPLVEPAPATPPVAPAPPAQTAPPPTTPQPSPVPATPAPSIPAPAPPSGSNAVSMGDNNFSPASLSVAPGSTVTWQHTGKKPHTVTSDTGLWDSGLVSAGQSYSFTFQNPGTYPYNCVYHDGMAGTVVVGDGASDPKALPLQQPSPVQPAPPAATPAPSPSPVPSPTATPPASATPPPASGTSSVFMGDSNFLPASLTVAPGGAVTWLNNNSKPHTVTSATGIWDSGLMATGQSYSYTFNSPGEYSYNCIFHDGMAGTITVSSSDTIPGVESSPAAPAAGPDTAATAGVPQSASTAPNAPQSGPAASQAPRPETGVATASAGAPTATTVSMGDSYFSTALLKVAQGATVTWINDGKLPHTATSDKGMWDSGIVMPGKSYSYTFSGPGAFSYTCILHSGMDGTVSVGDAPIPAGAASASPPSTGAAPDRRSGAVEPSLPAPSVASSSASSAPAGAPAQAPGQTTSGAAGSEPESGAVPRQGLSNAGEPVDRSKPHASPSSRGGRDDTGTTLSSAPDNTQQTPTVIMVQAPGMSGFEVAILAIALAAIAISSANLYVMLRPRRGRDSSNTDW